MHALFDKPSIKLTPKQSKYTIKYKVDFKSVWKTIHSLPVSCKCKSVTWQLYAKTLPLYHKDKKSLPDLESTMGIFFGMAAQALAQEIQLLTSSFLGHEIAWTPLAILPLHHNISLETIFSVCIFWGLWCFRNKAKHGDGLTSANFIHIVRNEWVHSLNKMSPKLATLSPSSFQTGPFWLTPTPQPL